MKRLLRNTNQSKLRRNRITRFNEAEDLEYATGDINFWKKTNKKVYNKILDEHRFINVEYHDWYEYTYEYFKNEMDKIGVAVDDIRFSGFYSQGDGASFTGEVYDVHKFLKKAKIKTVLSKLDDNDFGDIYIEFTRTTSRYVHEKTVEANVEFYDGNSDDEDKLQFILNKLNPNVVGYGEKGYYFEDYIEDMRMELEEDISDWLIDTCKDLYEMLNDENDILVSDVQVYETLLSNDYEFDYNGNIVN